MSTSLSWTPGTPATPGAPLTALLTVWPAGWQKIRVAMNAAPDSSGNAGKAGDALNPACWTVVRGDTGASLTVLAVAALVPATLPGFSPAPAAAYELTLLEQMPSAQNALTVGVLNMLFSGVAQTGTTSCKGMTWAATATNDGKVARSTR